MASKCRKFVPNIFHKSKCQNCFAAKDIHSAQALENNKVSHLNLKLFHQLIFLFFLSTFIDVFIQTIPMRAIRVSYTPLTKKGLAI